MALSWRCVSLIALMVCVYASGVYGLYGKCIIRLLLLRDIVLRTFVSSCTLFCAFNRKEKCSNMIMT